MFLVTTALMLEARPVISRLKLRPLPNKPYPIFLNGECLLVVTGTGNLKAAAATAWMFGTFPELSAAVNLGFCGATQDNGQLHTWYLIHSIRDASTGRLSVPDILFQHPFPEKALLTVPKVMTEDTGWPGVVDMEGSGFYETARKFLSPDRLALLKWVSDPLTGSIDVKKTGIAYESHLDPVIEFLEGWPRLPVDDDTQKSDAIVEKILSSLQLTETQKAFLNKWVRGYLLRGGTEADILSILPVERPRSKKANTLIFEKLRNVLKS